MANKEIYMSEQTGSHSIETRRSSGVVRSISGWTAFLFGIHCISLSSSGIIPFSWVASVWPGADILLVLTIAGVFCLIHACSYAIIGSIAPVEGADYFLASRVLSPHVAFAASWTLVIFSGVVAGGLAAWVPQTALPSLLRPMAIILNDPRFADLSDYVSSPAGTMIIGALIIFIAAITTVRTSGFLKSLLTAGFVFGLVAWIIILWSLASAEGPDAFRSAWNKFMGASSAFGEFDKRIPLAQAAGMQTSHSVWQGTLGGLIMGFWIYYGYYIPTFFAEEVKSPRKTLWAAAIAALLFAYAIFAGAAYLLQQLVSPEWIAAEGYLYNNQEAVAEAANGRPVVAMPWITFYAAILNPNRYLIYAVAFAWVFTLINLVQTYLFYSSRIIFSWALDRVLPDRALGNPLRPSFGIAVLITSVLAIVGLADAALVGGLLGTQLKFAFFAVVTNVVPIFALTSIPVLSPDLFSRLPSPLRRRYLGVPGVSWIGGATLFYLIVMIVALFAFPAAGIEKPIFTVSLLIAFIASGLFVFTASRNYRKRTENIDIIQTFKIPGSDKQKSSGTHAVFD
jgi:amino acid transporter